MKSYSDENQRTYWFVFCCGSLLLVKDPMESSASVPFSETPPTETKEWTTMFRLPDIGEYRAMAYSIDHPFVNNDGMLFVGLRDTFKILPKHIHEMAGKAAELLYWDSNTKYCGVCGAPMKRDTEISKKCTNCGKEVWPQVAPAIIVRIERDDKILLVKAHNFKRNFYGLVAGFVETGENLEDCVIREVAEETGLKIKNVRYFGSQAWPYPSGIMIGFTAEYADGELHLQKEELSNGGWFSSDNMPEIPDKISIARMLIDDWICSRL